METLRFEPLTERPAEPGKWARLLQEFRKVLETDGMASMDEYGDMLKWGLPSRDGWCRYFHVFHPGYCSFSDAYYGTIHTHGGAVRGTVLAGCMEHTVYEAQLDSEGDRFYGDHAYRLHPHLTVQPEGTSYELPAHVPHWTVPKKLTITYFEEEDNGAMGELVNPASDVPDDHLWEQSDADALMPDLMFLIDEQLDALTITV